MYNNIRCRQETPIERIEGAYLEIDNMNKQERITMI